MCNAALKCNQQLHNAKCNQQLQNSISTCKVQNSKFDQQSVIAKIQYDEGSFPADYLEDLVTLMEGTNGFGFKHSWGNLRRIYLVS